jgi:colanic acid/amylovoran biosynthesis glycosyltransferase
MQGARLVEKKGVDLAIRAYAEAYVDLPASQLWIVGDGPERSQLETLAARTGLDSIHFFGEVSHESYRQLASQAHVCIQPSRTASDGDTEGGAPTVLVEMQAVGVPIVATRHADIPFVVADADRLVDEEDVSGLARELVRTASLDELERQARAKQARTFVEENHDARLIARRIEALYAEAMVLDERV